MVNKSIVNARMIFASMVPMTIGAFLLGYATIPKIMKQNDITIKPGVFDCLGMVAATIGICLFNWYEEKP